MHHVTLALAPKRGRRLALGLVATLAAIAALSASNAGAAVPEGVYYISPEHTVGTKVLDVAGAATAPAAVTQYPFHGGPNQRFRIQQFTTTPFGTPVYRILSQHVGGMCLDISGANPNVGAPLTQFPCHGQTNQQWFIGTGTQHPNTYTLVPRHSGNLLEVPGGTFANVQLALGQKPPAPAAPFRHQRFKLTKISN